MSVIDSFVIELGLDTTKFTANQQQALEAARKLEQQQVSTAKNVEHGADRAGDAISGLKTQALSMLAVFTGGKGLVNFATDLTHADAKLGRLERNIGVSASTINAWQGAARIFGGDAQSMAQSFTTVSDAFAGWKIGQVSPMIADLRAISTAGGTVIDMNKGVEQSMLDLSANLQAINKRDPAQAGLLGRRLGLDPALFDLMIQGPDKLQQVLEYVRKIGVATKADTDSFGELEKRIGQMGVKAESLGRKMLGGENGGASQIMQTADFLNKPIGEAMSDAGADLKQRYEKRGFFGAWYDMLTFQGGEKKAPPRLFGDTTSTGQGAFTSQFEKEQFIRSEAARLGINPNVAMQVAKSEGFSTFSGDGNTSFGAFQLHVTPGGKGRAVGDQFREKTGYDPSDPRYERQGISFALDDARRNGWGAYHGAARVGLDRWAGIDQSGGGSPSTSTVTIGTVNVTPPAGAEPSAWASSFADAVKRQSFTAQANSR